MTRFYLLDGDWSFWEDVMECGKCNWLGTKCQWRFLKIELAELHMSEGFLIYLKSTMADDELLFILHWLPCWDAPIDVKCDIVVLVNHLYLSPCPSCPLSMVDDDAPDMEYRNFLSHKWKSCTLRDIHRKWIFKNYRKWWWMMSVECEARKFLLW